ncbi:MAG: hypothetical protein ACI93S_001709, partial [Ancylomarina sp.]
MKKLFLFVCTALIFTACQPNETTTKTTSVEESNIDKSTVDATVSALKAKFPKADESLLARGVKHVANLWIANDGSTEEFKTFCEANYVADKAERELVFNKISRNLEIITGYFNKITLDLLEPVHLNTFEQHAIDNEFGAYSVDAHWQDDFYKNKIAFIIALNFPPFSLEEKEALAGKWNRQQWAYARLGDYFTARVPAE